jgi:8-oxo-dGTP diphosphatase
VSSLAAIALIQDERGRLLLVKQRRGPFAGSWLFPGGRAADDESVVHAAVREVREETGLTMTDASYVAGYRTSGDDYDITVLVYRGAATGTLVAERGSDVRWFDLAAIPDPHPTLRRTLMDTGVALDEEAAIDTALADAGITMERLSS